MYSTLATPLYTAVYHIVCKIHHSFIDNDCFYYVLAQIGSCDSVELRKKDEGEPTTAPRNKTGKAFAFMDKFSGTLHFI